MNQSLPTPTVLITGAGTGIGAATAQLFAAKNYRVLLAGRRLALLEAVSKDLPTPANGHLPIVCDVADSRSIDALVEILRRENIRLDALINNAGLFKPNVGSEVHSDIWRETFNINLFGAIELTEKLIPFLKGQRGASIVNISSGLGSRPVAGLGAYCASKAALQSWTQTLAIELGPLGIRVNAVLPGFVDTPIHAFNTLPAEEKAKTLAAMGPRQPLGRIGTADEIAESILFLTAESSRWTTGALLSVDGGINLV